LLRHKRDLTHIVKAGERRAPIVAAARLHLACANRIRWCPNCLPCIRDRFWHMEIKYSKSKLRSLNMIRKVKGGYQVFSENGRNLGGPYKTKAAAAKRLRQVEFFKRRKG
jgi:hypothetical protein